jgi:Flp pilus assembly protein TadG
MAAPFHRRKSAEAGAALVELMVTLPVLLALLIGTADFARVFYTSMQVMNAARAGAQYGAANLGTSADSAGMQAVAMSSVNQPGLSVPTATRVCQCAMADGSFPDTVACSDPPASACPSPKFRVITVRVTARAPFSMTARFPGLPGTLTVERTSIMRVTE